jgi:hypothetical protein
VDTNSDLFPVLLILWIAIFGSVGGIIGNLVGRRIAGFVLGVFLGPLGWLIVAVLPEEGRRCLWCKGVIPDRATKCMHCGSDLGEPPPVHRSGWFG